MDQNSTAIMLIGIQEDHFGSNAFFRQHMDEPGEADVVLASIVTLLEQTLGSDIRLIETPIAFSDSYEEIPPGIGLLKSIKEARAFQAGTPGGQRAAQLAPFADRITTIDSLSGFNAFQDTRLDDALREWGITHLLLCGGSTALAVDGTGRAAFELGYHVTVISDCVLSSNSTEHRTFSEMVFPIYANVRTSMEALDELGLATGESAS